MTTFDAIMEGFVEAQRHGGHQGGVDYLNVVNSILSVPEKPSAALVESALKMANTALWKQIEEHKQGGCE